MSGDEGSGAEGTVDETAEEASREASQRPVLRVVRGDPSPEELAALTVVLAAASGGGEEPEQGPPSSWTDRSTLVRRPLHPGRGAWVASGRRV